MKEGRGMGIFRKLFGKKPENQWQDSRHENSAAKEAEKILPGAVTRKDLGIAQMVFPLKDDFVLQRAFTKDQMLTLRKGSKTTAAGEWSWFMEGDSLFLCRNHPDAMIHYVIRVSETTQSHAVTVIMQCKSSMEAEKEFLVRWFDMRIGAEKQSETSTPKVRYDVREYELKGVLSREQTAAIRAAKGVHSTKEGWTWFVTEGQKTMNIVDSYSRHCVYSIHFSDAGDEPRVFVSHPEEQWKTADIKEELDRLEKLLHVWFPQDTIGETDKEQNTDHQISAEELWKAGEALEQQEKYEEAYRNYEKAAEMDDTMSMICIARMYLSGKLKPVDSSNLSQLLLQGGPIFPWSLRSEKKPDYKSGLAWLMKAADLGNDLACETVGSMLCEGIGCRADTEKGIAYLEKAAEQGRESARKYICLYRPDGKTLTNAKYETCLTEFEQMAESGNDKAYELYATLKSGTPKQLARLGHVLIAAQNVQRKGFDVFRYASSPSGIPLLPVASKRGSWRTFVRFNLDAWEEKHPLIAISADILNPRDTSWLLGSFHHGRIVGTAEYRSPEFGWLGEEKHAVLIRLGVEDALSSEELKEVVDAFHLIEEEYQGESVAFMVEEGEKEYSFEVAGLREGKVEVLWRYTIGGSNEVERYFEPQLISMDMQSD